MARKKKVDDLLDTAPAAVHQPGQPIRTRGTAALYDATLGAPFTSTKGERWVLVIDGKPEFFHKRKDAGKALRSSAPRKAKVTTESDLFDTAAPADNGTDDDDLHAASESGDNLPRVPSVWKTDGGRYGLLVYYGRSRAKMINCISGGYAVQKLSTDQLFASEQETHVALAHQRAQIGPDKNLRLEPGDMWWPNSLYTPEHFCNIIVNSQLSKSESAQAFLDKLMADMDELIVGVTTEEDLLS